MAQIVKGLNKVAEFKGIIRQPRFDEPADISAIPRTQTLETFLSKAKNSELTFERLEFRDPFLVVYSSGTTGPPKCIAHSVGGLIIHAMKEGRLHRELGPESTVLQYTTTGWIMYSITIQGLMFGSRRVLYDGSPFFPKLERFLKLVREQKYTQP
jgi:acetoacetyl-CoA synthetase